MKMNSIFKLNLLTIAYSNKMRLMKTEYVFDDVFC